VKKLLILFFIISLSVNITGQSNQKIGYVDTQVILAQYAPAIKAQSDLEALATKWRSSIDSMTLALQTGYNDYQKQAATMTPERQQAAQQNLIQEEQMIQNFNQQKFGPNGELAQKQESMMAPIREKIYAAIEEVAGQEGMKFIFDKAGDVILLFADPEYDMTFKVLDKLKTKK
jgi:outer membrane protein